MNRGRHTRRGISRRAFVLGLLAAASVGILTRAVYLQVFHKDFLQGQGDERHLRVVQVPAHRGMIVDRNGEPLAVSSPVDSVWANPGVLSQHRDRLPELSRLLGIDSRELEENLQARETREFMYLRRHLPPDTAQRVVALKIPGVYLQREYRRFYPTAEVTSQLLGFTDIDDNGQEGVELTFNDWLHGEPGSKRVIKDRMNRTVEDVDILRVPLPGKPVPLSIDRRIQYLAYRALKAAVLEHRADAASAVVVDVSNGDVLAIVNQPAANPNDRQQIKSARLRNRAVTDLFEPGSTMKPFTVAMALESGSYRPTTMINTAPGRFQVGRHWVRDVHNYGLIDVFHVISKSSNVGASKIALSLPAERLWKLYSRLGFGAPTGMGLKGEEEGVLWHYSKWSPISHANHSFGYGLSVNMLQLTQAYAVLAADGVKRPLSILHRDHEPPAGERIFSAATARQVRAMLEAAVSKQGTGFRATVPGYRVAGKTGTVHKAVAGRYAPDRYFSVFAGMAPASRPRLVMVIMVDEPKGGEYYGGQVAAPVFSAVMAGALRILNVTPDDMPGINMAVSTPRARP